MIIATGHVIAREETVEEILAISREHVQRSRREPGCLLHSVHRDVENPLRVFFFERWADRAALAAHVAVPEVRAFGRRLNELAAERGVFEIYEAEPTRL